MKVEDWGITRDESEDIKIVVDNKHRIIAIKDHEIQKLINDLRDVSIKYANTQQLRERISGVILPIFNKKSKEKLIFKG